MKIPPLILASRSPRRQALLKQIGLKFKVRPSTIKEKFSARESPVQNVKRMALEKAFEVARRIRRGIVVGADTLVVVEREILGKPKSKKEAERMLRLLSGREHFVYTGFALVDAASKKKSVGYEKTKVKFRNLTRDEIFAYVRSGSPLDKAGAYGIQDDYGAVFVEKVNGCFYNVVGFPLARFYSSLQKFVQALDSTVRV